MSDEAPDSAGSQSEALASFIGKWRARWPEWSVAEVFLPGDQREPALAWASLLQELTLAAWTGAESRPGELKLAWWQEELAGWARGARRHPLGIVLQRRPAPWNQIAAALPALQASRERPGDADEAFALLGPFSTAAAAVERALFSGADSSTGAGALVEGPASTPPAADGQRLITATLLHSRFLEESDRFVPLAVVARASRPAGDARVVWAGELRDRWPLTGDDTPRVRRLWSALARRRLAQDDVTRPLSGWTALRTAWSAARN